MNRPAENPPGGFVFSLRAPLPSTISPPVPHPPERPRSPRHAPLPPRESSSHSPSTATAPVARSAPVRPAAESDTPAKLLAETHTAPDVSNAAREFFPLDPAPREWARAKNTVRYRQNPKPSSPYSGP